MNELAAARLRVDTELVMEEIADPASAKSSLCGTIDPVPRLLLLLEGWLGVLSGVLSSMLA